MVYAPPVSVPVAQSRKNNAIAPKWFNSLDTNSSLGSIVVCMTFGADKKEYMSKSFLLWGRNQSFSK